MIVFQSIKYKNILSTGNRFTTIDFRKAKHVLIVGENGAGKSTMLDALSFALFGKAHRAISKTQLINSVNKRQMYVELKFAVGGYQYTIKRGQKPSIFEIWRGDKMLNESSNGKEYQRILEQNILKLNHKSFHQIVVLGSSSFIPFMQLPAAHRRTVIEDLLDINVFSKMNELVREDVRAYKEQVLDLNYRLNLVEHKIETQTEYIAKLKDLQDQAAEKIDGEIQAKLTEKQVLMGEIDNIRLKIDHQRAIYSPQLPTHRAQRDKLVDYIAQFKANIKELVKTVEFFENNEECPTCSQDIDDQIRKVQVDDGKAQAKKYQTGFTTAVESLKQVNEKIRQCEDKLQLVDQWEMELKTNQLATAQIETVVQRLMVERDAPREDLDQPTAVLNQLIGSRQEILGERDKISDQLSYSQALVEMMKDTGIKTKIVKQYLPVINQLINQYLQILDFFVHFDLDESFTEVIRSRHRDEFTYSSFSEGEKQRIDLALLFTWRMIAKMKNSVSTNLLVLDETFDSSLDQEGIDNLMKILYTLEEDTNTFVISHKGEIIESRFNEKIEFVKEGNFSKMKGI